MSNLRLRIKNIINEGEFDWVDTVAPRLEVGRPVTERNPKNTFRFDMEFMHGDADAYTNKVFDIKADDQDTLNHWLLAIELNQSSGRDGTDEIAKTLFDQGVRPWDLDDYYEEFEFEDSDDTEIINSISEILDDEISEWDSNGYGRASTQGFSITYFDENGLEHEVKINPINQ